MSGIQPLDVALRGRPLALARSRAATWQLLFFQRRQQDQSHLRPGSSTCRSTPPGVNRFRLRSTALPGRSTTSLRVGASPRRTTAPVGHESATAAPLLQHSWLPNVARSIRPKAPRKELLPALAHPRRTKTRSRTSAARPHTRRFVPAGGVRPRTPQSTADDINNLQPGAAHHTECSRRTRATGGCRSALELAKTSVTAGLASW